MTDRDRVMKHARASFAYADFAPRFRAASAAFDPGAWAALFERAGARYVVFVTKHHDGFTLWPTGVPNPRRSGFSSEQDVVAELASALERHCLRLGIYYSGGLDWTFEGKVIQNLSDVMAAIPQTSDYAQYALAHWRELIARYRPRVLWNDIGFPAAGDVTRLQADYYNQLPGGVVNDRFALAQIGHADFQTPEYDQPHQATSAKWETVRGMGYSFGYNQAERPEDLLAPDELIRLLADVVSKNGNLLLNVGPTATGEIPALQAERLEAMGAWLRANGEAIYATRPWERGAEGTSAEGLPVRFTRTDGAVYALVMGQPPGPSLTLPGIALPPGASATLLSPRRALPFSQEGPDLRLALPADLPISPVHAVRLAPMPL